jgi:hypothetical protein
MALQAIFGLDAAGHDILAQFKLVAANSGGSITLGGLIENKTLRQLRDDFFLICTNARAYSLLLVSSTIPRRRYCARWGSAPSIALMPS